MAEVARDDSDRCVCGISDWEDSGNDLPREETAVLGLSFWRISELEEEVYTARRGKRGNTVNFSWLYDRAMHRKPKGYQDLFQACVTEGIQEPLMRLCLAGQRQEQSRMAGGGAVHGARGGTAGAIADSRVGVLCRWGTLFPPGRWR